MGNCGLKPIFLSGAGAPAPEEFKISLLEDQTIHAGKSLSNLFLQDKADEEKTTPEKMPVTEDMKTALAEAKSPTKETKFPETEIKSPAKETKALVTEIISPETETKSPEKETKALVTETKTAVTETAAPADDQKAKNEEAVCDEKVIDGTTVKETETEAKPEEVRREAAA